MGSLTFNVRRKKCRHPTRLGGPLAPLGHALIANPQAGDESRLEPASPPMRVTIVAVTIASLSDSSLSVVGDTRALA
jgi:hypothetical protein